MPVSAEKKAEYNRRYYESHKAQVLEHNKEMMTPSVKSSINKRYYEKHRDELLAKKRERDAKIKASIPPIPEFLRTTDEEKKEDRQRRNKEYYRAHKEEIKRKRLARKAGQKKEHRVDPFYD